MKDKKSWQLRDAAIRAQQVKQLAAAEQEVPHWQREEQYQTAIYHLVAFSASGDATLAQDWAVMFCEAGPLLIDRNMDFALRDWIRQADLDNAGQLYCQALELFLLGCRGDKQGIVGILKRAQAHDPHPYLGVLRDRLYDVREQLLQPIDALPWTPVFKSRAEFARAIKGLPRLAEANIKRAITKGTLLEEETLGGMRYRSTDPEMQRTILAQIRKSELDS